MIFMKLNDVLTIHDTLNRKFWADDKLKDEILYNLRSIAQDFFKELNLEGVEIDDITFTGSLANFNYTSYSDIDLHILVDFNKIDENEELVREYFSGKSSNWNNKHNINIFGHEVEIYVQNSKEPHHSTGIYSIKREAWVRMPKRKNPEIDLQMVKRKVNSFVDMIERAEDTYDAKKYIDAHRQASKLIKKIKNFRQAGLEERGEYSYENLTFKYLRNKEHMKHLFDLRDNSYDKELSLEGKFDKKFKIFINQEEFEEKPGFQKLEEIEKFQKKVKRRHARAKRRLIGLGKQKAGRPYSKKPNYRRGKSSPAGFGGV
jgi:predicted nucleotidyltransferase